MTCAHTHEHTQRHMQITPAQNLTECILLLGLPLQKISQHLTNYCLSKTANIQKNQQTNRDKKHYLRSVHAHWFNSYHLSCPSSLYLQLFQPDMCILSGQTKTFCIFFNIIVPRTSQKKAMAEMREK